MTYTTCDITGHILTKEDPIFMSLKWYVPSSAKDKHILYLIDRVKYLNGYIETLKQTFYDESAKRALIADIERES